ncbi:hypothetical protein BaRGS_00001300, partial [Batillaria attramentaria]
RRHEYRHANAAPFPETQLKPQGSFPAATTILHIPRHQGPDDTATIIVVRTLKKAEPQRTDYVACERTDYIAWEKVEK